MNYWRYFAFIGLVALLAGCNTQTSDAHPTDVASTEPTTATVKRQDVTGYSFFDGALIVPTTAQGTAYSPYDTPVVTVMTSSGKFVDRGEPIVKLAIPGADQATNQARANSTVANASLADQKSTAYGPVKAAQQALKDAKDAETAAKETVSAGGTADVEAATQTRIAAEAALKDAQQQMQQSLEPAKQVAATSAAQLNEVKADAAQGIVRAPISGTVVSLNAQPGMDAKSKQELATVVDYSAARVQATVPPELKGTIVRGSRVIVAMTGPSAEPLEGRVLSVKVTPPATGDVSSGYLAIIQFTKPRSLVPPIGSVRRIGIKTGEAKQVLVVPVGAIVMQDGKSTVKTQKGADWVPTIVQTGLSDGNLIEIKSGLSMGDVVQVSAKS